MRKIPAVLAAGLLIGVFAAAYADLQPPTPEEKAAGMANHWEAFKEGREPAFYTYFMLEAHESERKLFLSEIGASEEIPYPDGQQQAVLKAGRAVLWATSHSYVNGDPCAVFYAGSRMYPVE